MNRISCPSTPAVRFLRERNIPFTAHAYPFVMHGGTHQVAESLHIPEHRVIKTLVMEDEGKTPFLVLMHGDKEVSTKGLARHRGCKLVRACSPRDAQRITGYQVGGISPFGTRMALAVYAQASIFDLDQVFINGGTRGLMVQIAPRDMDKALEIERVDVAIPRQ